MAVGHDQRSRDPGVFQDLLDLRVGRPHHDAVVLQALTERLPHRQRARHRDHCLQGGQADRLLVGLTRGHLADLGELLVDPDVREIGQFRATHRAAVGQGYRLLGRRDQAAQRHRVHSDRPVKGLPGQLFPRRQPDPGGVGEVRGQVHVADQRGVVAVAIPELLVELGGQLVQGRQVGVAADPPDADRPVIGGQHRVVAQEPAGAAGLVRVEQRHEIPLAPLGSQQGGGDRADRVDGGQGALEFADLLLQLGGRRGDLGQHHAAGRHVRQRLLGGPQPGQRLLGGGHGLFDGTDVDPARGDQRRGREQVEAVDQGLQRLQRLVQAGGELAGRLWGVADQRDRCQGTPQRAVEAVSGCLRGARGILQRLLGLGRGGRGDVASGQQGGAGRGEIAVGLEPGNGVVADSQQHQRDDAEHGCAPWPAPVR